MQAKEEQPVPDEGVREPDDGSVPPCDPAEPIDVEALQAEAARAAELDERLKRAEAEFVNETRRIRRNASDERKYAIERVVVDLLPVVDALHSARDGLGEGEAADQMRQGLDLVDKQLASTFELHGVTRIEAMGQPFDPGRHQALMMVERPELEPQTVCEVMRHGYELNGRVVRPAEVVVVKAPPAEEPEGDTPDDEEEEA